MKLYYIKTIGKNGNEYTNLIIDIDGQRLQVKPSFVNDWSRIALLIADGTIEKL